MFGALRKLLGMDDRPQVQDASQMPKGMRIENNPVSSQAIQDGVNSGALRQLNNTGTYPPLPQGIRPYENPVNIPEETGLQDVNGLPVSPSYIFRLLNR